MSDGKSARTVPMHEVRVGDEVVVGYEGVRIEPQQRPRQRETFGFMGSPVSSERAKALAIRDVANAMIAARQQGEQNSVGAWPRHRPYGGARLGR